MPPLPKPRKVPNPSESCFRVVPLGVCSSMVLQHHYSRRLPKNILLCYADVEYGPPKVVQACCIFCGSVGRWPEKVWELTRLVRLPDYSIPLSKLVSKAIGHIRANRLTDLVVSLADVEEDHHGGIYQACSWLYAGIRNERLDGFNLDGHFVPARTCNHRYGTSSGDELRKILAGTKVEEHFDAGKHCYWKAITKAGMQKAVRLGLGSFGYPKPMLQGTDGRNKQALPGHVGKGIVEITDNGNSRWSPPSIDLRNAGRGAQEKSP